MDHPLHGPALFMELAPNLARHRSHQIPAAHRDRSPTLVTFRVHQALSVRGVVPKRDVSGACQDYGGAPAVGRTRKAGRTMATKSLFVSHISEEAEYAALLKEMIQSDFLELA